MIDFENNVTELSDAELMELTGGENFVNTITTTEFVAKRPILKYGVPLLRYGICLKYGIFPDSGDIRPLYGIGPVETTI